MNTRQFFADRGANLGLMVLAAVVMLAAPAAWADPPSRAARLSYITGPVALAPAGLPDEWGEAFVNRPITVGDRLWADAGGRAELRLGSTAVRIDGGTSLDVLDLDDRMLQLSLDQGRAQVRTRGGQGGNAEIDTPAAAVVINGAADVRVDVDAGTGRTFIAVRYGRANVYTPYESFDLASGETTRIEADGRYYTIGRAGARDAFDTFAYTRDTRWREPRYVSAEMTGYEDLDAYGAWQPVNEYGTVWFPRQVANDWAPYRDGRWVWVEPWGWTWVDNAPWGFAPFHYGRWVQVSGRWGWWPGERVASPVYAPALVAFFGGDNFGISVTAGSAPAVGWFPLGYNDPYIPWYTTSPTYRRAVNVAYVRDTVVLNQVVNVTNVNVTTINNNYRYRHRDRPGAATMVPRQVFVSAQPVRQAAVAVDVQRVASAPMVVGAAPVAPERASLVGRQGRSDRGPRADRANKPLVAVNTPASAPPRFEQRAQESQREQGKPFEVKPLRDDRRDARRDDRQEATRSAGTAPGAAAPQGSATPQGAAAPATASAPAGRELRVVRPGPTESREARDRGAGKGPTAQGPQKDDDRGRGRDPMAKEPEAPRANVAPPQGLPPQAAPQAQERAVPAQGLPPQAAPQAQDRAAQPREPQGQDRGAQQREAQQRDQQQREQRANQEREQQQRAADERAKGQREAQERANQQREQQQRATEERAKGQRDAQERANQQREQQQRAAEERAKGQRDAQERANQQREQQQRATEERAKGQREAQERAAEERAKGQREAQERANQQRVAQQQAQAEAQAQARARQAQQQPQQQPQAQPQGKGRDKGDKGDKADDRDDREDRAKGNERRG